MKKNIGFCDFQDAFTNIGRGESFSYNALKGLYDYLCQLEEDCDMEIELDPIAFDCEYTEYEDIKEAYEVYESDYEELGEDDDEREENAREFLQDRTQLIEFDGGIIISNF